MAYYFNCPLKIYNYHISKFKKILKFIINKELYYCVEHQDRFDKIEKSILKIKIFQPVCFCFNDITDNRIMLKFLNKKFPYKSSFET